LHPAKRGLFWAFTLLVALALVEAASIATFSVLADLDGSSIITSHET